MWEWMGARRKRMADGRWSKACHALLGTPTLVHRGASASENGRPRRAADTPACVLRESRVPARSILRPRSLSLPDGESPRRSLRPPQHLTANCPLKSDDFRLPTPLANFSPDEARRGLPASRHQPTKQMTHARHSASAARSASTPYHGWGPRPCQDTRLRPSDGGHAMKAFRIAPHREVSRRW